jgi:hypothetical protein
MTLCSINFIISSNLYFLIQCISTETSSRGPFFVLFQHLAAQWEEIHRNSALDCRSLGRESKSRHSKPDAGVITTRLHPSCHSGHEYLISIDLHNSRKMLRPQSVISTLNVSCIRLKKQNKRRNKQQNANFLNLTRYLPVCHSCMLSINCSGYRWITQQYTFRHAN